MARMLDRPVRNICIDSSGCLENFCIQKDTEGGLCLSDCVLRGCVDKVCCE